jgi:hypothetical protein
MSIEQKSLHQRLAPTPYHLKLVDEKGVKNLFATNEAAFDIKTFFSQILHQLFSTKTVLTIKLNFI